MTTTGTQGPVRVEPRVAGEGAADEPRVRFEAWMEGNCYWLGHADGAEGAFSKFVRPERAAGRTRYVRERLYLY